MRIVSLLSQKGGVGKSTIARALATEAAKAGLNLAVADLDLQQSTFTRWHTRRLTDSNLDPVGTVQSYRDATKAIQDAQSADMLIIDGQGMVSAQTLPIAKASHLVVVPSGVSSDDTDPTIELAAALRKQGVEHILITLCRVSSQASADRARANLERRGLSVLPGYIPERTSYSDAQSTGKSILETRYKSTSAISQRFIDDLVEAVLQ